MLSIPVQMYSWPDGRGKGWWWCFAGGHDGGEYSNLIWKSDGRWWRKY